MHGPPPDDLTVCQPDTITCEMLANSTVFHASRQIHRNARCQMKVYPKYLIWNEVPKGTVIAFPTYTAANGPIKEG